jgi:hypothetical protein
MGNHAVRPVRQLTDEEFNALPRREQLDHLLRTLLEFDRRYRQWLSGEMPQAGTPRSGGRQRFE